VRHLIIRSDGIGYATHGGLLKSQVPDLDPKLLQEDYRYETNAARDTLIDGVFNAAQHFVSV
jgi:hypothetical protein